MQRKKDGYLPYNITRKKQPSSAQVAICVKNRELCIKRHRSKRDTNVQVTQLDEE